MDVSDVPLSRFLHDEKKTQAQFITKEKIALSFCEITRIDRVPYPYNKVPKLYLSHNKLSSLDGIEQFQNLEHLSLSYNRIEELEEFYKVNNSYRLKEISIRGNPLERHPNHVYFLVDTFPSVVRVDDFVIEPEDRKLLMNYEKISGLIIPFYLSLQRDLETLIDFSNCVNKLHEERFLSLTPNNLSFQQEYPPESSSATQLIEELKTKLSHKDLLSVLDFEQKKPHQSDMHSPLPSERSPLAVLENILSLINGFYPNFDHINLEASETLYETYKFLFNELLLQYHGQLDKSLDMFLTNQVLKNRYYDLERFSNDSIYAFECILLEFYKLMPAQATFTQNIVTEDQSNSWKSDTFAGKQGKSPLDIGSCDPEYLKTAWLAFFPVFPLNKQYLQNLHKVLCARARLLKSVCKESFEVLEKLYETQKNEQEESTLRSARQHDRSMEGRMKQSSRRYGDQTFESQAGYSTRDSIAMNDTLTTQRTMDSKGRLRREIPEEKSILPILLLVKLNDKLQEHRLEFFQQLKQIPAHPELMRFKRLPFSKKQKLKYLLEAIDDRLMRPKLKVSLDRIALFAKIKDLQQRKNHQRKQKVFEGLLLSQRMDAEKADVLYRKNLYLKSIFSIMKVISRKRKSLNKILTKLDSQINTAKTFYFTRWKMLSKAMGYLSSKRRGKNVHFDEDRSKTSLTMRDTARSSRMDTMQSFSKQFDRKYGTNGVYLGHSHHIFRKCTACDAPNCLHLLKR